MKIGIRRFALFQIALKLRRMLGENLRLGEPDANFLSLSSHKDVFSEEGSSFVPDGTRFLRVRSPSDESLGFFRASLRDLDSRCLLIRSNRRVADDRFPV